MTAFSEVPWIAVFCRTAYILLNLLFLERSAIREEEMRFPRVDEKSCPAEEYFRETGFFPSVFNQCEKGLRAGSQKRSAPGNG